MVIPAVLYWLGLEELVAHKLTAKTTVDKLSGLSGNDRLHLLLDWEHLLSNQSTGSNDFTEFLNNRSSNGVHTNVGRINGGGLSEGTRRGDVVMLNVNWA